MLNQTQLPRLSDLYQLGKQIELDNTVSQAELHRRDHAIGKECPATDNVGRLLYWLHQMAEKKREDAGSDRHHIAEESIAFAGRIIFLVFGFTSMSTFLLASGQGLVNVFVFLLLFVFLQSAFCIISVWVMYRSMHGSPPVILPVNPVKYFISKRFPDKRFFRECQSLIRLLVLRYGQEMGALFTIGAVLAFFIVLAFSDFTFVWGSTFSVSDQFVKKFADTLSSPWLPFFPATGVSMETVVASRYHPALTHLAETNIASMRRWWPLLIMSMFFYALLPRLVLWSTSKFFYGRSMRSSFVNYPGSERVLSRMVSPVVSTQGTVSGGDSSNILYDHGLLLIDWAGALDRAAEEHYDELQKISMENIFSAGTGSISEDAEVALKVSERKPDNLLVAVKAWEPPMSDLKDFISSLMEVTRCTLYLLPLGDKAVSVASLDDWRAFSRDLPLDVVDMIVLEKQHNTEA